MSTLSPENLLARLEWRYAAKSFDPSRKIPADVWTALEKALVLTPSSYGLQPWKFIVIESAEFKNRLRAVSFNQRQVTECSHFVVFTHMPEILESDIDKFLDAFSSTRSIPRDALNGYRNIIVGDVFGPRRAVMSEWTRHQCYIALGNFMTSAAVLGVDTCPMEGLVPAQYDDLLGLKDTRYRTVVACAAGYRSPEDKTAGAPKVRYSKADLVAGI
jgi:nitroreductase